jgi:hypothetical protein
MNESSNNKIKTRGFYEVFVAVVLLFMAVIAPIALSLLKGISAFSILAEAKENLLIGMVMFIIVVFLDILVAWGLMKLFINDQKYLSIIAMIFRIIYAVLLLLSLSVFMKLGNYFTVGDYKVVYNVFNTSWNYSLVVFGIHLILIGIAIIRSKFLSWILGVLVIISGFGYIFDTIIKVIIPNNVITISVFTFIGEVLLIIWLPVNAIRTKKIRA